MIALFTDFGLAGPYVGQLHAVLAMDAPGVPVINLFHAVPPYDIRAAAYLLPAYATIFPQATVFTCIVDPGVGGRRRPIYLHADGKTYVGPDNGIFNLVMRRARQCEVHEILWRPDVLSESFHGRDLFAPVAAMLALGRRPESQPVAAAVAEMDAWPDDLMQILYIDDYGNAITGMRAAQLPRSSVLRIHGVAVPYARVFDEVPPGQAFWYGNSNGLVEIAVSGGNASRCLGVAQADRFDG